MNNKAEKYLVGIDLGTTHTVVAYVDVNSSLSHQDIKLFQIEQLIAPGEVAVRSLLPSTRYHPAKGELAEADTVFSPSGKGAVIGEIARVLGAKTQGRLVTSAKSWLSHPSVDHSADILPWGSSDEVQKISPVNASASYLSHVRTVWDRSFTDAPLAAQSIVITVPASFDEGARALTLEAANIAGLSNIRLLEEPQAVCYDWLRRHTAKVKQTLQQRKLLLICDVGGGTTDLTLIKVEPRQGEPKLSRIGVGHHLMLGGDNIDLTLSHLAENRLIKGQKKLVAADLFQLIEQCRIAKERLLAENAPEQCQITLLGGGSRLIGGLRSVQLTKAEVRNIVLDGFFPLTALDAWPDRKRSGVVEFGLPYAADPAISKHIAAFLALHHEVAADAMGCKNSIPDTLLLNGGVFRSQLITQRMQNLLNSWSGKKPVLLENLHPELSVAFGAVSYALARRNKKVTIGGGAARSYFLKIDTNEQKQHGICVLPQGSEEGLEVVLKEQKFALKIGQPVQFHLVSTTENRRYQAGQLLLIDKERFHSLPPLAVAFDGKDKTDVIVQLAVTQTEMGTLKIQCLSVDDQKKRFDVEFHLRKKSSNETSNHPVISENIQQAIEKIQAIYGVRCKKIDPKAVKSLRTDLERIVGMTKETWEVPQLRILATELLECIKFRRRSAHHERLWLSLVGFCLRPGFGYPLDGRAVEHLWKTYSQGIQFVNERQNWTEWWTLWRRISGGLNSNAQKHILNDIAKFLNPATAKQAGVAKQIKVRGYDDMVRLVGVLEHLPIEKKVMVAEWLLTRLQKSSESNQTWWAVGRIAARVPFYGSHHNVVAEEIAVLCLQQILTVDWKKVPQAGFAATLIARMSGDRVSDVDDSIRLQIIEKLKNSKAPPSWIAMVEVYKVLGEKEEKQIFGEALPPGLKLISCPAHQ